MHALETDQASWIRAGGTDHTLLVEVRLQGPHFVDLPKRCASQTHTDCLKCRNPAIRASDSISLHRI